MINDFFNLLFPKNCGACRIPLLKHEGAICTVCLAQLPRTQSHLNQSTQLEQLFWGRIAFLKTLALFYFEKQGKVQQLIHNLKYKGQTQIGVHLGEIYGIQLKPYIQQGDYDFILPVPLSKKKATQRGYNQSEFFAQGLSNALNIPIHTGLLKRSEGNYSQTLKSRFARWENVHQQFVFEQGVCCKNKRIILVDDVITTGATLEACAQPLISQACELAVIAIAFTKK